MNAPKLRFKEFNDEWQKKKIDELFKLSSGSTPATTEKNNYVGDINWISSGELKPKYINKTINCISKKVSKSMRIYPKGTLLIALYGLEAEGVRGTASILNIDSTISQACMAFEPLNNNITNEFMYYWYKKNGEWIGRKIAQGTKQQNLTSELVKPLIVNYPQIIEQNKIEKMLSLLDRKIELQSKKIEDLKLFKLYTENSLLNSSSSIHWKKLKLNDILIEGNKEPVKNTNDFKKITIKLNLNGLEFNESKREMSDKRPFYIREENEIIIGKQNYFNGSIAIVTKEFSGCICSNAIMSFKVKEGYNLKYIYLYLSQKRYMKEREFLANGTGQKELSEKEFLKFTIKVPEDSVVNNITNIIDKINKKINFENNKLNKLIELKKGLMQNMFV